MALPLLILFMLSSLPLHSHLSSAADSISGNQSLSGHQKLVSKGGKFDLGFFPLGNSPQRHYLGIWYNTNIVSKFTPVWVANRDTLVFDFSSYELKLSKDGNLVLLNQSKSVIWSTETNITCDTTIAVLLDSGNLVLQDGSNASRVLWQSLDHPTDTWLPGGKFGLNVFTGEIQQLIAWRSAEDPSHGFFCFEIDPRGSSPYFILWNGTKSYWSSGNWNGKAFSGVPGMADSSASDIGLSFQFVNNASEKYFTYNVNTDLIYRVIMDYSGQIKHFSWLPYVQNWMLISSQPIQLCEVYAVCGSFGSCNENKSPSCGCIKGFSERSPEEWDLGDKSGGCVRNTPLQCEGNSSARTEKDIFYQMEGVRLPANPQPAEAGNSSECESTCLNNCSCTAYSYSSVCSLWFGNLLNIQEQYDGAYRSTLFLRLAANELPSSSSKKTQIIGVAVGGAILFLVLLAIIWLIIWRQQRRRLICATKATSDGIFVAFRYSDLNRVTRNFSEKLGSGGFGSVYKGVLPDLTPIAVKKLINLHQRDKQFRAEVSTIGAIQHINLIRLRGFCTDKNRKCLVYEFMPNSSLDTHLFHGSKTILDWGKRYHIALGIARGLVYLHEKCRDCIIHCDIKPENILLDASFSPKVADFGLAKLIGRDLSRVLTTMRGTRGYLAPEWITGVSITAKADVYSYGMMLFEIISGKRNTDHWEDDKTGFFPASAMKKLMIGDILSLLDPRLEGDAEIEVVERACKVACWCIQDEELSRPTMGQVLHMLEGIIEISMPPVPKFLQLYSSQQERIVFFSDSSVYESNQIKSPSS